MKTAIYARVSTNNGQDSEMQLREIREYIQRRGWELAAEFVDAGVSGAKDSRPELNRLMAEAHRRRFDAVVVWKFDRFARSVSHLLRALEPSVLWESILYPFPNRWIHPRRPGRWFLRS